MMTPRMSRPHFEFIAEVLREIRPTHPISVPFWCATVEAFAVRLELTSGRFDRKAFLRACGLHDPVLVTFGPEAPANEDEVKP